MPIYFKKPAVIISISVIFLAVIGFFYFSSGNKKSDDIVLAKIADLSQEVSVVGRVKPTESAGLSFNVSGQAVSIPKDVGQEASRGQTIIQLDTRDAQKSVVDAEIALEKAVVDLERLRRDTNDLVVRQRAEAELRQLYEESFNLLSVIFSELPTLINDLEKTFKIQNDASEGNVDYYRKVAGLYYSIFFPYKNYESGYLLIRKEIVDKFNEYQKLQRNSPNVLIDSSLNKTYESVESVSEFFREARDITRLYHQALTDFEITPNKISVETTKAELDKLTNLSTKVDGYLVSLSSVREKISNQKNKVVDVDLDLQNQELIVKQRQNDLKSARDKLSDHFLTAPFDGVVSNIVPRLGEHILANQVVATLISEKGFEIEANVPEADIAKIKVGDLATLTLDAYGSDTVFKASVFSIDPAETKIEGLSTYKVVLHFTENDPRIKSGLTADILILTESKSDVLVVPQRAVFRKNGGQFVRVLKNDEMVEVSVETGLRGSDGNVEILSGLGKGDRVIISF